MKAFLPFRSSLVVHLVAAAAIFFTMACAAACAALASETRVTMKQLPKAVQKTVVEQTKGATVRGLSKEIEHGKTVYEVEMTLDGRGKDVSMDARGNILEVEQEVDIASLPETLRSGLQQKAGAGKITKVESITEGGKLVKYEAQVLTGKKRSEVHVAAN